MKPEQNATFFVDNEHIRLSRDGIWYSDETEITHEATQKMFFKILRREADGWYLKVGKESKKIEVEDTAFFVRTLEIEEGKPLRIQLTDETFEALDIRSLKYKAGRLTVTLKNGMEAKFLKEPYYRIMRQLCEDAHSYYLDLFGEKIVMEIKTEQPDSD